MILLLDENMPPKVADAIHALGTYSASHSTKYLPRGAKDTVVFAFLKNKDWLLLSLDKKIAERPHEIAAYRSAGVGGFVLMGKADRSVEQMCAFVFDLLPKMRKLANETPRPFLYGISPNKRFKLLLAPVPHQRRKRK